MPWKEDFLEEEGFGPGLHGEAWNTVTRQWAQQVQRPFDSDVRAAVKIGLEEASVVGIKVGDHSQSPHLWSHTGQKSAWGAWGTCQGPVGLVFGLQGERESQEVGGSSLAMQGPWRPG